MLDALVVLLKIGMVFGLLAAVLVVLKKTDGLGARARGGLLEVRGSTRVGKGATLTAVRVDGRDLLLGVTEHTVTLLASEPAPAAAPPESVSGSTAPRLAPRALALREVVPALRRRTGSSTTLPDDAVAAALAALRGELPRATDGPVAPPRTDARSAEEQPCADPAVA